MAINFDQLPKRNPSMSIDDGIYRGRIVEATMRKPQDVSKPSYLSVTIQLFTAKGSKCGRLFDRFFDSDNEAMLFKLFRFVTALGLNLKGATLELKDLTKLIVGKDLCVDVINKENDRQPGRKFPEANIFGGDIYWNINDFTKITGEQIEEESVAAPAENPFPAVDNADSAPFNIGTDGEDEEF